MAIGNSGETNDPGGTSDSNAEESAPVHFLLGIPRRKRGGVAVTVLANTRTIDLCHCRVWWCRVKSHVDGKITQTLARDSAETH